MAKRHDIREWATIGGLRLHALHDSRVVSAPGRQAARTALDARLLAEIDPQGTLSPSDRAARLQRARSAHFRALRLRGTR